MQKKQSISCKRGQEDGFEITLNNCNFDIQGSRLKFQNQPQIKAKCRTMLLEHNLLQTDGKGYKLSISDTNIKILSFKSCKISNVESIQLDFRGDVVQFIKCSIDGVITYLGQKTKFSNSEKGEILIEKDKTIVTTGVSILFIGSCEIICGPKQSISVVFLTGRNRFTIKDGECNSIKFYSSLVTIVGEGEFLIGELTIKGYLNISSLKGFDGSVVNVNSSTIKLKFLKIEKKIIFSGGILLLVFENVDLSESIVEFNKNTAVDFSEFSSIATEWLPERIKYRGYSPGMSIRKMKECNVNMLPAQEFYCEMKTHFSNRGNKILAAGFYAVEMKAHLANLRINKSWWDQDRFISVIAFVTSNYGQNWLRPLIWYICVGLEVTLLFLWFGVPNGNYDNMLFIAGIFSPLSYSFEHVTEVLYISNFTVILWMIWKIVSGYLLYQIIIGTRKFVRNI